MLFSVNFQKNLLVLNKFKLKQENTVNNEGLAHAHVPGAG
jgi:hypothetical protein